MPRLHMSDRTANESPRLPRVAGVTEHFNVLPRADQPVLRGNVREREDMLGVEQVDCHTNGIAEGSNRRGIDQDSGHVPALPMSLVPPGIFAREIDACRCPDVGDLDVIELSLTVTDSKWIPVEA
jgi:hypothetical protein